MTDSVNTISGEITVTISRFLSIIYSAFDPHSISKKLKSSGSSRLVEEEGIIIIQLSIVSYTLIIPMIPSLV